MSSDVCLTRNLRSYVCHKRIICLCVYAWHGVCRSSACLRRVGGVNTYAGSCGTSGNTVSLLHNPTAIAYHEQNNTMWIADTQNGFIRSVPDPPGAIVTHGPPMSAPSGVAVSLSGVVVASEGANNHLFRKLGKCRVLLSTFVIFALSDVG